MSFKEIFDQMKDDIFDTSKEIFQYDGTDKPIFIWINNPDMEFLKSAASINWLTNELKINNHYLLAPSKRFKKVGYRLSEKKILISTLGEEASHFYHQKIKHSDFEKLNSFADEVIEDVSWKNVEKLIETYEKLSLHKTYIEIIGKAGGMFIEGHFGVFDNRMHVMNIQLASEKMKSEWEKFSNMLKSMENEKFYKKLGTLSNIFEGIHNYAEQVLGESIANNIYRSGIEKFRELIHNNNKIVDKQLLKKMMNENSPGIENYIEILARAHIEKIHLEKYKY